MVRISKQGERRSVSYKRPSKPAVKTGPKKCALQAGYKEHKNALALDSVQNAFFPKF